MRRQIVDLLLAAFLMQWILPLAMAQTRENQPADSAQGNVAVQNSGPAADDTSQSPDACSRTAETNEGRCVDQRPRQIRDEGDEEDYSHYVSRSRGRHALIGALIGFGIGGAVGAKGNKDQHTRARVGAPILGGVIGALIGAAVGAGHP